MEEYIQSVEGLIEGRNIFLARTLNQFRPVERMAIYNQYMLNERMYLELTNRIFAQEVRTQQPQLVINVPSDFLDSVPVTATTAQTASAIENLEGAQGDCAICQDAITATGVRIRQCGHKYHQACINSWLSMSVRCPVCRHDIRQADPPAQTSAGAE